MSPDFEINKFKRKLSNCNVKRAKILAIAFSRNDNIVTFATNQVSRGFRNRFTFHAEENLVRKLKKIKAQERFGKIDVLVLRWSTRKKWTSAKPCARCLSVLRKFGVHNIFFTDEVGTIQQL